MRRKRFISNKLPLLLCFLMAYSSVWAGVGTQHFLGLSVAGVEANIVGKNIKTNIGGGGQAILNYEVNHGSFLFNIGVGADYQLTRNQLLPFIESKPMIDISGEPMDYQYRFEQYREQQTSLYGMFQLLLGVKLTPNIYLQAGAHFRYALSSRYVTTTLLQTTGAYSRWAGEYIANVPSYGFYPLDTYTGQGNIKGQKMTVAPVIEFGTFFPLNKKTELRIAFIGEYALPLNAKHDNSVVDYSKVNMDVATWSQANLHQNINFYSLLDSSVASSWGNLTLGVKLSFFFNVTRYKAPCHCTYE